MIEDLYNYLRGTDEKSVALAANNMPTNVINDSETSAEFADDSNSNELATTLETTRPPKITVEYDTRVPGGTKVKKQATKSVWDQNTNYLTEIERLRTNNDIERATLIFSGLQNTLPVIKRNGKLTQVSISEFGTLMSSNPAIRESIVNQAMKYDNDPSFDAETLSKIKLNDWQASLLSGAFIGMTDIMNKEIRKAAQMNDRFLSKGIYNNKEIKQKAYTGVYSNLGIQPHELLFDSKNRLVDEKTYSSRLKNLIQPLYTELNKQEEEEKRRERAYLNKYIMPPATSDMMKVGLPNTVFGSNQVPKKSSMQKDGKTLVFSRDDLANFEKQFSYDNVLKNIKATYDGINPDYIEALEVEGSAKGIGTLLSTNAQFMMFPSEGGVEQGNKKTIPFDLEDALYGTGVIDNDQIEETEFYDNEKHFQSFINMIDNEDVIVSLNGYQGNIPEKDEDIRNKIKYGIQEFNARLDADLETKYVDKKKVVLPKGNIIFYPITGGNDEYMAFVLKFDPTYFQDNAKVNKILFGTSKKQEEEDKPKGVYNDSEKTSEEELAEAPWKGLKQKIINNGIVIYVPTELARENFLVAKYHKGPNDVQGVGGLLSLGKDVNVDFPGAGSMTIREIPNKNEPTINDIQITGSLLKLTNDGKSFDTIPMRSDTIPKSEIINLDYTATKWMKKYLVPQYIDNSKMLDQLKIQFGIKSKDELIPPNSRAGAEYFQYPLINQRGSAGKTDFSTRPSVGL